MCKYYKAIEKRDARSDALSVLDPLMYNYIYNVGQMIIFIDDKRYDEEEFIIEYGEFIVQ